MGEIHVPVFKILLLGLIFNLLVCSTVARSHFGTRARISNADSNVVSFTIKVAGRKSHRFLILVLLGKRLLVAMKTECSSHSE